MYPYSLHYQRIRKSNGGRGREGGGRGRERGREGEGEGGRGRGREGGRERENGIAEAVLHFVSLNVIFEKIYMFNEKQ